MKSTNNKKSVFLYVTNARLPSESANGYQTSQMCQAFIESGVNNLILVSPDPDILTNLNKTSIEEYYNLRETIPQEKLFCIDLSRYSNVRFLNKFEKYVDFLQKCTYWLSLKKYLMKISLNVEDITIFVRSAKLAGKIMSLKQSGKFGTVFVEVHGLGENENTVKGVSKTIDKANYVITITAGLKNELSQLGVNKDKILVAPNAMDDKTFNIASTKISSREKLGLNTDKFICSYIGRFITIHYGMRYEKGINEIILSSKDVINKHDNVEFHFVGGPMDVVEKYKQAIKSNGLSSDKYIFHDKKPIQELPYWLSASDILLMPLPRNHFYTYQVSSLKICEYMSAGKPIIASNLPSMREKFNHGINALLVEPGNICELSESINQLIDDPELRDRLGMQAKLDVSGKTWKNRAKMIIELLNQS